MPWVRLDDRAMDHPKFLALTDGAWRLWCEGQTYCQRHLTDGVIGISALKGFRYYTLHRFKSLTSVLVPGKSPCWDLTEDGAKVIVHDFLDWNESRTDVLKKRTDLKDRQQKWREERKRNALPDALQDALVTYGVVRTDLSSSEEIQKIEPAHTVELIEPTALVDPGRVAAALHKSEMLKISFAIRAGAFVERYKALHQQYRHGAHYVGKPNVDFWEAMELVQVYEDARLDQLAVVWLGSDTAFAESGTRTIAKFRSAAPWCEEKLILFERGKAQQ